MYTIILHTIIFSICSSKGILFSSGYFLNFEHQCVLFNT